MFCLSVTNLPAEVCGYLEDGLLKLQQGPVGQYIPAFNWDAIAANAGSSSLYNELVTKKSEDGAGGEENTINLRELICTTLDVPSEDLSDDVPLTQYGLDSLSASYLSYQLAPVMTISQIQLLADVTLKQLQERMGQDPSQAQPVETQEDFNAKHMKEMFAMAEKYGSNFVSNVTEGRPSNEHKVVFLTGSTGSVGAHMLARLLPSEKVDKVYAFMRKQKAGDSVNMQRQVDAFVERGLDTELLKSSKLALISGSLTDANLGMSEELYEQVRCSHTHRFT